MAAQIIMIVTVADDSSARRIEGHLEVIRQITVRRHPADYQTCLGDVSSVNDVVARFSLPEGRITFHVGPERVKDMPVRGVVTRAKLIAAIPDDSNGACRSRCHPWEDGSLSLWSITHADGGAPGIAFVGGEPNEYIVVVRIAGIGGAIRRHLDREEKVGVTRARDIVGGIGNRRQPGCRRDAHRDTAVASADVDRAIVLINRNASRLANGAGRGRVSVGKTAIHGALDLRDGRLECAIEQVDRARTEELKPLPVVPGHAAGSAAAGVRYKGSSAIGRALGRDVSYGQAGIGQRRRRTGILRSFTVETDRDIHVATTVPSHGPVTWDRISGARHWCDLVRLATILRIAHEWIVVRIGRSVYRRSEIKVPQVCAARHAANRRDVAVTELVAAHAGLDILADVRCPRGIVRAKGHATFDVGRRSGNGKRPRCTGRVLCPHRVGPTAGTVLTGKEHTAHIHLGRTVHGGQRRAGRWIAYFAHRNCHPNITLGIKGAGLDYAKSRDHIGRDRAILVSDISAAVRFHGDVVVYPAESPLHVPDLICRDRREIGIDLEHKDKPG